MSGAILLPARMPAIADLLLPLLLSVSEFLLFGALAYQITGFTQPDQVLIVWWFALGAFGAITFGSVWRVHYLVRRGVYSYELQETIRWYRRRLESDMAGAGLTSVAAILVAIYYLSFSGRIHLHLLASHSPVLKGFALAVPMTVGLLGALVGHARTVKYLRKAFLGI